MVTIILEILETAAIAISGFLIKEYLFLEPNLEPKKQRLLYLACFILAGITLPTLGKNAASLVVLVMIGLNVCLERKRHKLRGLLLMIPFPGIINGLFIPLMLLPYLFGMSEPSANICRFAIYGVAAGALLLFYFKGKKWRRWFHENIQYRKLRRSELSLLWAVGIIMLIFSQATTIRIEAEGGNIRSDEGLMSFIAIAAIASFIMTITIIVLIMQGNQRSFYHERLSHMQSGMIAFMAEVVESRDDNTGGHIRRTAEYVERIAKELKRRGAYADTLTDRYLNDMIVAAPLHDIGKIHIPDAVLNKAGRLTDEEFAIMKTHTTAGEKLLKNAKAELGESAYLNTAIEMAAYHHEWWNGKGYPYGIGGEEIPLCARIMAVADVYDALISKRCYKSAMPVEKARAIIREESGTHFDPEVVEAFFASEIVGSPEPRQAHTDQK
ncbi:MAG: HD-GYP domain-containing protein [Bacteroides sp.]|nr:HD-GYP domain-containing protein [Eubacterium sp.]MCM1419314.1 HD-GYP domain-containing protein [Roseburia sp.]MCM1463158.1 HD-GYP domain-containing protein [Bacteroides sp.]